MQNKYLYALLKDSFLRTVCIFSVIGTVFCIILIKLDVWQIMELKDMYDKQVLIIQIPLLQSKIVQMKGGINGLVLNGIISDNGQPMAVINNTLVKVGEIVGGKRVIAIKSHDVAACDVASDKCVKLTL